MLNGKTALITGGGGIGLATAKRLRAEGARVAITGADVGRPDEITAAVAFLAGDASRRRLGAKVDVDGGYAEL